MELSLIRITPFYYHFSKNLYTSGMELYMSLCSKAVDNYSAVPETWNISHHLSLPYLINIPILGDSTNYEALYHAVFSSPMLFSLCHCIFQYMSFPQDENMQPAVEEKIYVVCNLCYRYLS
jgi:hypothetical protein